MTTPMDLVIFQLNAKIERKTNINIRNNMDIEHPTPSELTVTPKGQFTRVHRSHGKGNLQVRKHI